VYFVPELIGSDVPIVRVKGVIYNAMPNLRIEVCASPPGFKADHSEDSESSIQYESLRHI
jgi:hypothetical protein